MVKRLPKFCCEDVDRHGNIRVYLRRKGYPKIRLNGIPFTPEFMAEYQQALEQKSPSAATDGKAQTGTWRWLCQRYFAECTEYKQMELRGQGVRRRILETTFDEPLKPGSEITYATFPVDRLTTKALRVLRDRKLSTPEGANNRVKAIRAVCKFAVRNDYIVSNPAKDLELIQHKTDGYHTWTVDEVAAFQKCHPLGSRARLALDLLLYTGVRRSDVVKLGPQHKRIPGKRLTAAEETALRARIEAGEIPAHAARALGIGARSAWRIAREMEAAKPAASTHKLGGSPIDRENIALRDEVARLRKELLSSHRQALDDEAVKVLLGRMASAPSAPPNWLVSEPKRGKKTAEVPVAIWSDWHMGETVSRAETNGVNEYNPAIAEARIRRLVESTILLCRRHGPGTYPGIVINLLGDFVSGGLHPELLRTDAEEQIPSALRCFDILVWALETMAREFRRV